jgi:hypothetical protein
MGITDIMKKAKNLVAHNKLPAGKKMTANEVELNYFKERERQKNITKELVKYRMNENMLKPTNMEKELGQKSPNILVAKNCFNQKKEKQHSILNQRRIF